MIPALKDFPDDIIVTFDDDLLFRPELIERLLIGYEKYPEMIQCHRITNIFFDEAGNVKTSHIPYDKPTYLHKLTGCGSVLYPPHSLHKDVLREDKFMTLAPTSDDIWFWLMGVLNGRRVNCVENNIDMYVLPGVGDIVLTQQSDYPWSGRVTLTIEKLKANQTYYVRIRTYTTVKKKNYYSAWSKVKAVKTKANPLAFALGIGIGFRFGGGFASAGENRGERQHERRQGEKCLKCLFHNNKNTKKFGRLDNSPYICSPAKNAQEYVTN